MATLSDIARAAGVSKMTVSNALRGRANVSEATRRRILQTAERLDYQPNLAARTLSSGRNNIIELIIQDFNIPFYSELASAITLAADRHNMQTSVRQTSYRAEREKNVMQHASLFCDALVLATPKISSQEAQRLAQHRPLILIDEHTGNNNAPTVNTPNKAGSYTAMAHLLGTGARRPILLGPSPDCIAHPEQSNAVHRLRVQGAQQALREHGMTLTAEQCIPTTWDFEHARETAYRIGTTSNPPDAIFALSDTVAIGAMRGLIDAGLQIPDDIQVIGFDGAAYGAFYNPPLSTIAINMERMAELIVQRITERLHHDGIEHTNAPLASHDIAPFELIIRESTRKAP